MINEYDRPSKGYKTSEQYDHPATEIYDNFAPKVEEEIFVSDTVEPEEVINEEVTEEVTNYEEKEGEE